jgi:hypothetical protein
MARPAGNGDAASQTGYFLNVKIYFRLFS